MKDAGLEFPLDAVDRFPLRAEFADSLDHPDPVPLEVLPRIADTSADPAESNAGSGCSHRVGGASQGRQDGDGPRRREASLTSSAQSTDAVNPEATG
ncbi:hypothetical protein ACQJBY_050010 [Aegilops geniculata]